MKRFKLWVLRILLKDYDMLFIFQNGMHCSAKIEHVDNETLFGHSFVPMPFYIGYITKDKCGNITWRH